MRQTNLTKLYFSKEEIKQAIILYLKEQNQDDSLIKGIGDSLCILECVGNEILIIF